MLSRSLLLLSRQAGRRFAGVQPVRYASHDLRAIAVQYKNDLDCMTVPEGSWKTDYQKKNAKYNMCVLALVVANVATYALIKTFFPPDIKMFPDATKMEKVINKY